MLIRFCTVYNVSEMKYICNGGNPWATKANGQNFTFVNVSITQPPVTTVSGLTTAPQCASNPFISVTDVTCQPDGVLTINGSVSESNRTVVLEGVRTNITGDLVLRDVQVSVDVNASVPITLSGMCFERTSHIRTHSRAEHNEQCCSA